MEAGKVRTGLRWAHVAFAEGTAPSANAFLPRTVGFASSTLPSDSPRRAISQVSPGCLFIPGATGSLPSLVSSADLAPLAPRISIQDTRDNLFSDERAPFGRRLVPVFLGEGPVIKKWLIYAVVVLPALAFSSVSQAYQLAISQYGRVTATLPWAVAIEQGYFDQAGIKIDQVIAGAGGGTTLRNVLASDLPYGEVATSAAIAAKRAGLDVVIVNTASSHIGEIALVADPKSAVHSVADLAGKKAGYTAPKSTSDVLLHLALKEAHLTGKVETIATGGFGPGLTALETGAIQAAPLIDPILTLQPEKFRVILRFADLIPRMTWLVGITTREFAAKNPELLRKLIAVRLRAVDYIYQHRDDAMRIYAKIWQQDPKQVATYFPKYFGYDGEWTRGDFEPSGLAKMSEGLQLVGDVDRPVDWKAIIDQEFLPKDLQKPL
jgi:NitT/TauT family transport system substrate-binding protein